MQFVHALDFSSKVRAVLALFEGGRYRRGRWLRTDGGSTCRDAAPLGAGARQRPCQPAQRAAGSNADRERRWRPCHLPSPSSTRRSFGHRIGRAHRLRLGANLPLGRGDRRGHRRGGCGRTKRAGPDRDAGASCRRRVERGRRGAREGRAARALARAAGDRRRSRASPAARGAHRAPPRRGARCARPSSPWPGGSPSALPSASCATRFPARLERGAGRPKVERLPYFGEMILGTLSGVRHLVLVGARAPVAVLRLSGGAERARARWLLGPHARDGVR